MPLQGFCRYTSLLLMVIAAGLLGSAVAVLQAQGIIPGSATPFFDISSILSDQDGVGAFLRGLFGYNATPSPAQFVLWALYLAIAIMFWRRGYATKA